MSTNLRSDIHRPSAIAPVDYVFVESFYQGASEDFQDAYQGEHQELARIIGDNWADIIGVPDGNFAAKNTCDHCGTRFSHGAIYRHGPSGDYLVVGHTLCRRI